jgi:3-hydroxyanthranilate 3,4-dioxygenase
MREFTPPRAQQRRVVHSSSNLVCGISLDLFDYCPSAMGRMSAFNIAAWLAENKEQLRPPVGNKLLYTGEFKVMLVAGPNSRTDYHVEAGEEWFYQLEGAMVLRVVDDGNFYDVHIGPGDTFCLPARVPHSPQRFPGSVGIVVERERRDGERDALQWYCQVETCRQLLFRKEFLCRDLSLDLVPIINEYFADICNRTCTRCGFIETPPE